MLSDDPVSDAGARPISSPHVISPTYTTEYPSNAPSFTLIPMGVSQMWVNNNGNQYGLLVQNISTVEIIIVVCNIIYGA